MANGDGGALIVGIEDDGQPIGTALDPNWLRRRSLELSDRTLLPTVEERIICGVRCLVVRVVPSLERVTYRGKLVMRVDDQCQDVPATAWADRQRSLGRLDWSAEPSGATIEDIAAGMLLLCPLPHSPIEFVRREVAGGEATHRVRATDEPLIDQFVQIEEILRVTVKLGPATPGLASSQQPLLPNRTRREALVNAIAHRD